MRPLSTAESTPGRRSADPGAALDWRKRSLDGGSRAPDRDAVSNAGPSRIATADRTVFAVLEGSSGRVALSTMDQKSSSEKMLDDYGYEEELQDFLAADRDPIDADPRFREDLRERLWAIVQDGLITRPRNH
jgi:hypothetical protein